MNKHSIKIVRSEEKVNIGESADTIVFHQLPGHDTLQALEKSGKTILLLSDSIPETITIKYRPFTFSPLDTIFLPSEDLEIKEIRRNDRPIKYNIIKVKDSAMIIVPLQYGDNKIYLDAIISGMKIDTTIFCFRNRKFYRVAVISSIISPFFKAFRFYSRQDPTYTFKFYLLTHGLFLELKEFDVIKKRQAELPEADFWVIYGLKTLKKFPGIQEKYMLILSPEDGKYITPDSIKIFFQDSIYTIKGAGITWRNLNLKKIIAKSGILGNYPIAGISGDNILVLTTPDLWAIQNSNPVLFNKMLKILLSHLAVPEIKFIQNQDKLYIVLSPLPQESQYVKINIDGKPYYGLLEFPGVIPLPELLPGKHELFIEVKNGTTTLVSQNIGFELKEHLFTETSRIKTISKIPQKGLYINTGFIEARRNIIFILLAFGFIFLTWIFEKLQEVTS